MGKSMSIGVGGVARKVKDIEIGVDGVARKVVKAYIGVNGVARQFWPSLSKPSIKIDIKPSYEHRYIYLRLGLVSDATGYEFEYSIDGGTTWIYWFTEPAVSADILSFYHNLPGNNDTIPSAWTSFSTRVRAYDASMTYSEWSSVSTESILIGAPSSVSISNTPLSAGGFPTIVWSSVTGAATYTIDKSVNGGTWTNMTVGRTGTSYTSNTALVEGTILVRVRAVSTGGTASANTESSTYTVGPKLAPPTNVAFASGAALGQASIGGSPIIDLVSNPEADIYYFQYRYNGGSWIPSTYSELYSYSVPARTSFRVRDIIIESTWQTIQVGVQAGKTSTGQRSDWALAGPVTPNLSTPSGVTLNVSSSYTSYNWPMTVSWNPVIGATSYTVETKTNAAAWVTKATVTAIDGVVNTYSGTISVSGQTATMTARVTASRGSIVSGSDYNYRYGVSNSITMSVPVL